MDPALIQKLLPVLFTHLAAFLIFIWLLNKFATKPVLQILDERRSRIADKFDEIDKAEKRVAQLQEDYEAKLREIDEEANARMQEEVNRGRRIAEEITDKARAEASEIVEGARANVNVQLEQARQQIKEEVVGLTLAATEKMLRERLDDAKHRELVGNFITELSKRN